MCDAPLYPPHSFREIDPGGSEEKRKRKEKKEELTAWSFFQTPLLAVGRSAEPAPSTRRSLYSAIYSRALYLDALIRIGVRICSKNNTVARQRIFLFLKNYKKNNFAVTNTKAHSAGIRFKLFDKVVATFVPILAVFIS